MVFPIWTPNENPWITFTFLLVGVLILVGMSNLLLSRNILSADATRRWVHCLVGITAASSPFIFESQIQPITLSIIFTGLNWLTLKQDLFQGIHSQSRQSYGTVYFPLGFGFMVLFFWSYSEFFILSLLVLAISDPLAAQVGQSTTRPAFFKIWDDEKTIQGTIAFFFSAFMIIYMGAQILMDASNNYLFGLALFSAMGATLAEITSSKGTDNISIPIISILFMIGYSNHVTMQGPFLNSSLGEFAFVLFIVIGLFSVAYRFKSLTRSGYYGGLIMGMLITTLGGLNYLFPLAIFFVLSSVLSKVIKNTSFYKTKGSQRDIIQVYANGGIPLLICLMDYLYPNPILYFLFLASVAGATSDTWATEIGKLSIQKPVSIITFQPMSHGLSGGITRIGTIGSLLGASFIGFSAWIYLPPSATIIYGIILCGFLSSIFDSIVGATLQRKYECPDGQIIETEKSGAILKSGQSWIGNDLVNLFNTLFGACAMGLYLFLL